MPNKLCADQKVIACVMPRERCNELTMEAARETLRSGVGVTASEIMRRAIVEYLERHKE